MNEEAVRDILMLAETQSQYKYRFCTPLDMAITHHVFNAF